jgi:hypothetical protein
MAEENEIELEVDIADVIGADGATSVQQITLYIPDTDREGKRIKRHQSWVKRGAALLAKMGGDIQSLQE